MTLHDYAVYYAARGFSVFPLRVRGKAPATANGFRDASDDPVSVDSWWQGDPGCNVGVATGRGLVVIDVDVDDERDEDGLRTIAEWEREHGPLPETFTVVTGRGGMHYYFRVDREVRCSANPALGVDVRGDGGYVVGAGSVHPNGRAYEMQDWLEDVPVAVADDNVYALIEHVRPRRPRRESGAQRAFGLPERVPRGCRHDTLVRYAASLRGRGMPDDVVEAMVCHANATRFEPPLPASEVAGVVAWACSMGPGHDGTGSFVDGVTASPSLPPEDDPVPLEAYADLIPACADARVTPEPTPERPAPCRPESPKGRRGREAGDGGHGRTPMSDDQVVDRAKGDPDFVLLWEGDTSGFKKAEDARRDLMRRIAFWCARDSAQVARVYKLSKMHKETESDDLVRALATEACAKARMVFDEELGSVPVSVAEGRFLRPSMPIWDSRGLVRCNRLADVLRADLFARTIDGSLCYWMGRWVFGRRPIEQATYYYTDELTQKGRAEVAAHVADNPRETPATDSGRDYDGLVYVQFENGTYRVGVDAVEEVAPDPSMFVCGLIPTNYDDPGPNAADDFLDAISCGDASVRAVLEEAMGACMSASHVVSKSIVLTGASGDCGALDASNGKSTFVNGLKGVLGPANVTCISPEVVGGRFQSASVIGKLAILADDINPDALGHRRNAAFKQIVSGNAIHTDVKGRDGCDFTPFATVVLSLNGSLDVRDMDGGLRRRLLFVPFRAHFEEGDRGTCNQNMAGELLRDEAVVRRFAALGVRGLQRLVAHGRYTAIEGADRMLDEVALEGEPVAAWVHDESIDYDRDVRGEVVNDVYRRFKDWCDQRGWDEDVPNEQSFTRRLSGTAEFVATIRAAIDAGRVPAPAERWKLGTSVGWVSVLRKSVRRYPLKAA